REIELLLQVGLRDVQSGIELQFQGSGQALALDGEPDLVISRNRKRSTASILVLEQIVVRDAAGRGVAQVPDKAIESGLDFDLLLRLLVLRIQGLLQILGLLAGILAGHIAGGIEDLD